MSAFFSIAAKLFSFFNSVRNKIALQTFKVTNIQNIISITTTG